MMVREREVFDNRKQFYWSEKGQRERACRSTKKL